MAKIKYWREAEKCYVDANGNRVEEQVAEESTDSKGDSKVTQKGKKPSDQETDKDE